MDVQEDQAIATAVRKEVEVLETRDLGQEGRYGLLRSKCADLALSVRHIKNGDLRQSVMAELTSFRVVAAHLAGDTDDVINFSDEYLELRPYDGGYVNVVFPRLRTLHQIGRHGDELKTWSDALESPLMTIVDKIRLLDHVGTRHPERLGDDERAMSIIETFQRSDLFQQLEGVPCEMSQTAHIATHVAALSSAIRRWNRRQAALVLESSD